MWGQYFIGELGTGKKPGISSTNTFVTSSEQNNENKITFSGVRAHHALVK